MGLYHHFIGVDIGKFNFVAAQYGIHQTKDYTNDTAGIKAFLSDYSLKHSLIVLEPTGGYEIGLLQTLNQQGIDVHRSHPRQVKAFMRSLGHKAKTEAGLAPRSNDSGTYQGYRSVMHGKRGIKPCLYMAAMAARNSHSRLGRYYEEMIDRGKIKKVALTALMRKIIVIANAKLKELNDGENLLTT